MKRKLVCCSDCVLVGSFASSAFAASTLKRARFKSFLPSAFDFGGRPQGACKKPKHRYKNRLCQGRLPQPIPRFFQQFPPSAKVDTIKVSPGETFKWMLFRKKGTGPVFVTKDVTWGGAGPLDAHRFYINSKGQRYEFVVLNTCGNFALKNVSKVPSVKTPATPGQGAMQLRRQCLYFRENTGCSSGANARCSGKWAARRPAGPAAQMPSAAGKAAAAGPGDDARRSGQWCGRFDSADARLSGRRQRSCGDAARCCR